MRARHYDPTTGRFLQPDPEGIASTQRYAFAEHNPYIYNDPTGRSSRGIGSLDRGVPSWAFEGRPNELAGWDVATAAFGDGGRGLSGLVQHDAAVRGRWADEAWDDGRYASWAANSTMAMFNEYVGGEVAYSLENPGQTIALAAVGGLAFRTAARATGAVVRGVTVLGENMVGRVMPFAERTGARTLGFGTNVERWAQMTPRQRWKLNDGQLRKRMGDGDRFRTIGIDSARDPLARHRFDLTRSELLRLSDRGISVEQVSPKEVLNVLGRQ